MKTYLLVNVALLSLPLYLLLAWLVSPPVGAAVALAYAVGWSAVTRGLKAPPVFESALIAGLLVVLLDRLIGPAPRIDQANGALLLCLALGAAVSVVIRKPWTATFSAAEYGGASRTPLFLAVNMAMSAIWAVLFAWLGVAAIVEAPPFATWAPVVLGAVISVFLPKLIVTVSLRRAAAGDRRNDWKAPDFPKASAGGTADDAVCDVAVIGAGLGGLTAAALLAQQGLKVSVFEQHVVPGGFAHTWLRRARTRDPETGGKLVFRFDSGVHDISGWHAGGTVRTMFERLGIAEDMEWKRLDHRYMIDGKALTVSRDWRQYVDDLAALHPQSADGIRALFQDIRAVYDGMYANSAERGGVPGAPTTPEGLMAFAKDHPLAVEWMERPWVEFVGRHVRDEAVLKWVNLLSGYITDAPDSVRVDQMVPIYGYYFKGGHYPVGGSGAVADSLAAAIERCGGTVHLRTNVLKIATDKGAATGLVVADRGGAERRIRAGAVVCNADLRLMLDRLLDDRSVAARLEAQAGPVRPACSALATHLGLRGDLDLPPILHMEDGEDGVGLIIPSAVDAGCAPQGYTTMEVIRLIDPAEARTWFPDGGEGFSDTLAAYRRSPAYRQRKRAAADRLLASARRVVPDIDERIVYRADASPVTFARYSWTADGAIYGIRGGDATVPTKTPLRNLVLAGAATHGPGVEAVVMSGAHAAEALLPGLLRAAGDQPHEAKSPFGS